jgi:glycolate oxidase iron-sulfur subunit
MSDGPIQLTAWDSDRPPEPTLIDDCVHCGFCLPTCPTYELWGQEADSPRGRIVLMKAGHEEGGELSAPLVGHIDNCLGCMACVTACPSGVQYDKLIEDTRAQIERNWERPLGERLFRRLLFSLFPHPGRMRAVAPFMSLTRALRLDRLAQRLPLPAQLRALAFLTPTTPLARTRRRLPERIEAAGKQRGRVGFLQGCVQRVFFHDVNVATVRLLQAEGWEVHAPRLPRCCGALQMHSGVDSRDLAREVIAAFEDCEHVVINAAGCGSAMKDYGHLLRDDDEWAERAEKFAERVCDVTEILAEHDTRGPRGEVPMKVAYHDACHLAHAQGVRSQPRELLREIPGVEIVEPDGWEICCGSAGVYNLVKPEPAAELGRRKAEALLATGAEVVVAGNPGCALQIQAHARELGHELPVLHPTELLDRSMQKGA